MAQTANNNIAPRGKTPFDPANMKPTALFTSAAVQMLLVNSFKSEQKASIVTSTMISILNISPRFQNGSCGMDILSNVFRYEIGMGLSWAMGDYAVVDYGGKPTFQMQYQGVAKMAFASGKYADGDWYDVRQGEYKGLDRLTRRPVIEWMEDDEKREALPIAGYYVWVQLIDSPPYNGKIVGLYMSHEKILRHADTYSKAFQNLGGYEAYKAAMEGKRNFIKNGSTPWFTPPDSGAHQKMCKKTVLLQLLKNPFLPKSNGVFGTYIEADEYTERTGEAPTYADEYDRLAKEAALSYARENLTAQIETPAVAIQPAPEAPAEVNPAPPVEVQPAPQAPSPEPARRGRPKKTQEAATVSGNGSAPVRQPDFPSMDGDPFPPNDESEALW